MASRKHGVAGIFGETIVEVDLDLIGCAWVVKADDGRILMQVPWRWMYDQKELGKRSYNERDFLTLDEFIIHTSRWEALEMCMCAYPLTYELKQLLDQKFPGMSKQRQHYVRNPIWRPANQTPPPDVRPNQPSMPTPPVVEQEDQTVVDFDVGERKLLL